MAVGVRLLGNREHGSEVGQQSNREKERRGRRVAKLMVCKGHDTKPEAERGGRWSHTDRVTPLGGEGDGRKYERRGSPQRGAGYQEGKMSSNGKVGLEGDSAVEGRKPVETPSDGAAQQGS